MKKFTLLKSLLVVMALSLFSFSAVAETITIDFKDNSLSLPVKDAMSTNEMTFSVDGIEFGYKSVYYNTSKYAMFSKSAGVIYNKTSLGTINSISVTYTSGTSEKAKMNVSYGASVLNEIKTSGYVEQLDVTKSATKKTTQVATGDYFNLSVSNANNVQIETIVIDYVSSTGGEGGDVVDPEPDPEEPTPDPEDPEDPVVPEGPKVVTIAEFLAAEVNAEVWYELTGVITDIEDAGYGNVTIKDETGSVYIYGLTKTQVSSNDKSFTSLDLVVNDTVTLRTVRGEFNGEVQGGGKTTPAYYVSHKDYVVPDGGEDVEPEPNPDVDAKVEYVDEQGRTVYPFANVPGFAEWGTSYAEHVVEYNDATVTFESANKQQAGNKIDDIPVTKGKYVQLALKDATKAITSVRLVCRQWGTKAQTITLNAGVSEAGLAATEVTSSNFVLETNELPTNSNVIRFTFSSTDNQIGVDSIYYTVGDKVAVAVEQPTVSVVGGEKYEAFDVELACATADAKVYYTLNGGEKTEYAAPIKISSDTELKAWAEKGEEKSAELVVNYTFPAEVADIAALIADATGKNVRIAATLTVIAQTEDAKYLWVTDATTSMLVYGYENPALKAGDRLTGFVGKGSEFNGAKQITPAYFPEAVAGTPVEPTVMALADVTATTVHQYIKLEGVTYTNATTLTAGDNTLAMYDRFGYTYAGEEGDKVDVIAIAGLYKEAVQVYPISIVLSGSTESAVDEVVISNIYTQGGTIVVDRDVRIYTIAGQDVTDMNGNLVSGVYVVKTDNEAIKVVVK
ncbi:MAG: chitobiase/beta-hexosaminidase C-terminal domain-containing protein [Paludibacteraceae bacterium]|nr:chitobiase/beta-hexosaminidase C-terminal domain-containing protein [Paludibacteraceae bacterium]